MAAVTYGSARLATAKEVKRAGMLGSEGIVLGTLGRDYLRHAGEQHVLVVGSQWQWERRRRDYSHALDLAGECHLYRREGGRELPRHGEAIGHNSAGSLPSIRAHRRVAN